MAARARDRSDCAVRYRPSIKTWYRSRQRGLDFPNVEAARKGAREIAKKLRAGGMFTFGFSDWQMTIMNEDGKAVAEFPLEEHDET